jgi:hypothetical protein
MVGLYEATYTRRGTAKSDHKNIAFGVFWRSQGRRIFKSAALAVIRRPGPSRDYYDQRVERGRMPALLRLNVEP